jgi:hypothetical protein
MVNKMDGLTLRSEFRYEIQLVSPSIPDVSMSPEKLTFDPRKITRVRIVKMIRFGDKITADHFKQQKQYFYNRIESKGNWENMNINDAFI